MSYELKSREIEMKLRRAQNLDELKRGFITDGVADIERWRTQQIRILFIGKEAHGKQLGDWSLTRHCLNANPTELCEKSRHSWTKPAYVSFAIQNGLTAFSSIPSIKLKEDKKSVVAEALRTIAFINVGKCMAESITSSERLAKLYNQNRILLHEQIQLFQPNIIIGWGTLGLFERDKEFKALFMQDKTSILKTDGTQSWVSQQKLFVSAYHPSYFKVPTKRYVQGIIDAVEAHKSFIDYTLPIF